MTAPKTLQDFIRSRGSIQELNPAIARIAIEGYVDELSPAQKTDDAFYRQFACPSCGCSSMTKEFLGGPRGQGVTWVEGSVTPQALLRCQGCQLLLNPRSGIIVETGKHTPMLSDSDVDPGLFR